MRKHQRIGAAAVAALTVSALLPLQSAFAEQGVASVSAQCQYRTAGSGTGMTGDAYLRLTLSAASVATTGHSPEELARMLLARSKPESEDKPWTMRGWEAARTAR